MARDRRRIVYDNDATVIEEIPSATETVRADVITPRRAPAARNVDISIADIIGTFASYTQFNVDKGTGDGSCIICNAKTQYPIRKICVNCMKKYSEQIYDKVMNEMNVGNRTITLSVND